MKKAFVYPSKAPYRSGNQPRRTDAQRASLQFEGVSSPRKRKRSPDVPPPPSSAPDKRRPSTSKDPFSDEEDDVYLDQLGTAALEEYELTQRSPQQGTSSSSSSSSHHPTTSSSSTSTRHLPSGAGTTAVSTSSTTYLHRGDIRPMKEIPLASKVKSNTEPLTTTQPPPLQTGTSDLVRLNNELTRRLKEFEDKTFEKDGEVKLLRSELKKKEEQLREMHSRLVMEHKKKEEDFHHKTKSLSTQLEFKEQELAEVKDRCSSLEQRHKNIGSVIHTTPGGFQSRPVQRKTGDETGQTSSQFLSTETFMPLTQSPGNVTPVQVSSKSPKRTTSTTTRAERDVSTEAKRPGSQHYSSSRGPSGIITTEAGDDMSSKGDRGSVQPHCKDPVFNLPSSEISSQKLLELLSTPELLQVPQIRNEEDEEEGGRGGGDDSLEAEASSLPGILSLLHFPQQGSSSSSSSSSSSQSSFLFPNTSTTNTPVTRLQYTTPGSKHNSSSDLTTDPPPPPPPLQPSTPKRDLRLRTRLANTASRTITTRGRVTKGHFPLRKTQSALTVQHTIKPPSTTVVERESSGVSKTLLDSLDVHSLTSSIRSMLTESETSTDLSGVRSITASPHISAPPSLPQSYQQPDCVGIHDHHTPCEEIQLLELIGNVVIRYVAQQQKDSTQTAPTTSIYSDHDSFSFDNTDSPRSSTGSGKTMSSSTRTTSELNSPSRADQSLLYRSLRALYTLLIYRSKARDQLLAPIPPKYHLEEEEEEEGEEVSTNEEGAAARDKEEEKMEEGGEGGRGGMEEEEKNIPIKPITRVWKGKVLHQMAATGELSRVWLPQQLPPPVTDEKTSLNWRRRSTSVPLSVTPFGRGEIEEEERRRAGRRGYVPLGRKGGELLGSLIQLVSPLWKESNEVILLVLNIFFLLVQDCPIEHLERFAPLLERDGLDTHLADDHPLPSLCLESLKILTFLANSPQLIQYLCPREANSVGCLLQSCYEFFTMRITDDHHIQYMIHMQLVQMVSNLLMVEGGTSILFDSDCPCSDELLKYVVTLIQHLIQDVCFFEDFTKSNLMLLYSLVILLNRISLTDRHFDRHRECCEYVFSFSIRTLKYLFDEASEKGEEGEEGEEVVVVDTTIKYLLAELYAEFCEEEEEDSPDGGRGDGGRGGGGGGDGGDGRGNK